MTKPDAMKLLIEKVAETSQAKVAKAIGVSGATISLILSGNYPAAPDEILKRVVEVFGGISVDCPVLGEIPSSQCAEERKKPFAATSHQRVALWKACQACERSK